MSDTPEPTGHELENAAILTRSHMMATIQEVLPGASSQILATQEQKGFVRPVRVSWGRGNPKRYRIKDAFLAHHACAWIVAAGEPTVGRILGHNAGAYLRRLGLANVLAPMAQGYSVLRPMMVANQDIAGGAPVLIRPEDRPTDPVMWGTLHPWPDLRDSLSAVLRKLGEVYRQPRGRSATAAYRVDEEAARALDEVRKILAKRAGIVRS